MTIRMLQAWNGLHQQKIVTTLSGSDEAALVAAGIATYDLDGPAENLRMAQLATDAVGVVSIKGSDGVSISALGVRTTPLRVATFGDSTANVGSTTTDISYYTAPFPASGATVVSGEYAKFSAHLYYPMTKLVANGGVSGETTAQMLARDTAGASATRKAITDILALSPDVVLLRGGSINDITGATSATADSLVAATFANHVTILNRLLSGGVAVIDSGIYGYSGGAAYPDVVRSVLMRINALISEYISSLNNQMIRFNDLTGVIRDSSGAYLSGMSNDGTHLNLRAGLLQGQAEAALLTAMFGRSAAKRFVGQNLIPNALFASTSAVSYGTVATGYSCASTNATIANAKIESIDGKLYQTVEITPNAAGANAIIYVPFDVTTFGIVANDIYGSEVDWFVEGMAGAAAPTPTLLYVRNDIYKSGAGRFVVADTSAIFAATGQKRISGHSSFSLQIQEPSANLTSGSAFPFMFQTNDMTPFKLGISQPRFVKLGQTVLTG